MAKKKNRGKKGGGKSGGNVAGQDGSQGASAAQDNDDTVGIAPSVKDSSSANHVDKAEAQVSPSTASTEGHTSKKKCDKQAKAAAVKVGTWKYFILL